MLLVQLVGVYTLSNKEQQFWPPRYWSFSEDNAFIRIIERVFWNCLCLIGGISVAYVLLNLHPFLPLISFSASLSRSLCASLSFCLSLLLSHTHIHTHPLHTTYTYKYTHMKTLWPTDTSVLSYTVFADLFVSRCEHPPFLKQKTLGKNNTLGRKKFILTVAFCLVFSWYSNRVWFIQS